MIDAVEDLRNEFKEGLTEKLEREVIAFLNAVGGNLYIGVDDNASIVGIKSNIDEMQLQIKDKLKNNIEPAILGLFVIEVKTYEDKKYISIASGSEKPYYLKKKGMTPEGCFIRVGSAVESLNTKQIEDLFSSRTRNSLKNIVSPEQQLTFSQLKIYYEEKGFTINDNFLKQLGLVMKDGQFNYVAYLLSDNNNISIKVATYKGTDAYDLIENKDYGHCCLIKATKNIINKFDQINTVYTKITFDDRKELPMFDSLSAKEAITNALCHTLWEREYPPKFEIFKDHISITSTGGLPPHFTEEEFLKGFSAPRNPELMKVFNDLDLVEQLGTGIIRILKVYDKSVYEFTDNFIRVNFKFNEYKQLEQFINENDNSMSEISKRILALIEKMPSITQNEMSKQLGISIRTLSRHLNELKNNRTIERIGSNKKGYWKINN